MATKVAMIGWEYPPFTVGGLGIHCAMLTRELVKGGVEVDFYKPRINGSPTDTHVNFHELILQSSVDPVTYDLKNFWGAVEEYNQKLVKAFDPSGVSLIHCHDWIGALAAIALSKIHSIPLVVTVHSTEFDRSAFFNPQEWIANIERSMVHAAKRVIVVSGWTKTLVCEKYARCDGVHVVHNGFNPLGVHKTDYERKGRIIFLGRLTSQKGPRYLVEAARVALKVIEFEVVFAGSGDSEAEIRRISQDLGIQQSVKLLGRVSDKEMKKWIVESDAYVLPAVSEPFGMTVLEAMSAGLPTIISKTTGVGEALTQVLKFDFWDTLELADLILAIELREPLRKTLGIEGKEETKKFSWEKCAQNTLEVYKRALSDG
ncbi:hypothetical protein B9Q01_04040 [Candidatus Marsarchaeota G1 archaeon OSP_D]|jgi:glycosyltransferase involved in cell wall biosynthesis|uniref:Glycosyl transferase family 1 n=2 Tax=Candidatus Marsarchaeota group 1 TaxID=2203770 RepID=A0A2R6AB57_9ARCH|nr:MAG: hypothetical protein B9Q01_04040 [Candidatus Marsarchaeota G1 archaeon OSP_D]PSN88367.1 MAG: hypothetical protein B9Q00_05630 [Candidatus Marsarchaeota G1 archaeon OSP_C]